MKNVRFGLKLKLLFIATIATVTFLVSCTADREPSVDTIITSPPSITGPEESLLKIVTLTENQVSELNIETHLVTREAFTYTILAPGEVFAAPEHMAVVSTPVDGRITRIFAHEGEVVEQGAPLLEMESLQFAELIANFLEAQAEKIYLEQQVARLSALVEKRISSQSSLDRAAADLARTATRIRAARARLQAVGINNREMDEWNITSADNENVALTVYAPIAGKINHHLIDLGQAVHANTMLMDIVNNRQVLVRGFLDPEDIPYLEPGAKTVISQRSSRDENRSTLSVEAEITTIQPGLDQENKSVIVNSLVNTSNQWPVIGQSVRIEYEARTQDAVVSIPLSAIQFEGQNATVFVRRDERTFENRPIVLDRILQESAIVLSGLSEGEKIAVSQVFSLKALGKFEEFSED